MKIQFIESFLTADKCYTPENYDKDGFYFNKQLNGVYCVYTTIGTPNTTIVAFICPYDSLEPIHKYQEYERSEKENSQLKERVEAQMRNSRVELVSTPDPTVSERFALKMLSIAMKNDKIKDL